MCPVSYTHLDVYKRQVEDAEQMLPPIELVKPVQPENQPEKPARPEDGNLMEMMRILMEDNRKNMEKRTII